MAIEIRDAVKKYGRGESEICALDHVNLRIEKGEVCVILGPSGSGKSTLLNMIGGLDRLDAGTVTVEGVELAKQNRKELTEYRRKNVGVVFQSYNLIAELTVQENIRVVADIAEHPLALAELMEDLGLSRHAKHFSVGALRRTAAEMRHRKSADQKIPRSCCVMSRPARSIPLPPERCSLF